MLHFLFTRDDGRRPPQERKVRLFAVACCRRVIDRVPSAVNQHAIEAAEQFAETPPNQLGSDRLRTQIRQQMGSGISAQGAAMGIECAVGFAVLPPTTTTLPWVNTYDTRYVVNAHRWCAESVYQESVYRDPPEVKRWQADKRREERAQCALLRCIVGNPFRLVTFNPAWLSSDVVPMARGIYDDRAFDRMPILADALQDAGCDNDDILNHCRDTNTPHARGCWVVDLVLGKA
jgi:hypothetical protein